MGLIGTQENLEYDTKTSAYKEVSDNKRKVEIGDTKDLSAFQPQAKIIYSAKEENEANFSLRLVADEQTKGTATVTEDKGIITWATDKLEAKFYNADLADQGGYKIEVWLKEKPASNVLQFTMNAPKNLVFYYQGELDEKRLVAGHERPENIVGSYAVYCINGIGNEYQTGKVGHLYRVWAEDATGKRVWCKMVIVPPEKGKNATRRTPLLNITIPQDFLDAATYPVLVDPPFGYTAIGATASSDIDETQFVGSRFTSPSDLGAITSMSIYTKITSGTASISGAMYITGDVNYKLAESSTSAEVTTDAAWKTVALSYEGSPYTDYYLCAWASDTVKLYYDSVSVGYVADNDGLGTYADWPEYQSLDAYNGGQIYSIYATYTPSNSIPDPPSNGLIGWYKFDEGQGRIVYDHSGKGNNALFGYDSGYWGTDPHWNMGGLQFVDPEDIAQAPHQDLTSFTYIMAFKFNADQPTDVSRALMGLGNSDWYGQNVYSYYGDKRLYVLGDEEYYGVGDNALLDGRTYVFGVSYDSTTGLYFSFVDSYMENYWEGCLPDPFSVSGDTTFGLGGIHTDTWNVWGYGNKTLYEALVYNRALTPQEVVGVIGNITARLIERRSWKAARFPGIPARFGRQALTKPDNGISALHKVASNLFGFYAGSPANIYIDVKREVSAAGQALADSKRIVAAIGGATGDTKRIIGATGQAQADTERTTNKAAGAAIDSKRQVSKAATAQADAERVVGVIGQAIADTKRIVTQTAQVLSDTLRKLSKGSSASADTKRAVSTQVSAQADSKRQISKTATVSADSKRLVLVIGNAGTDTMRKASKASQVSSDTKRSTSAVGSASIDTQRIASKVGQAMGDTLRRVTAAVSFPVDTLRIAIRVGQTAVDTFRKTNKAISATVDTRRKTSAQDTARNDTLRKVSRTGSAPADTRRKTTARGTAHTDTKRTVNKAVQVLVDTVRRISHAAQVLVDSLRNVRRPKVTINYTGGALSTIRTHPSVLTRVVVRSRALSRLDVNPTIATRINYKGRALSSVTYTGKLLGRWEY